MSLWLQDAVELLQGGEYAEFREKLLPTAPCAIPDCLIRELEFGERKCPSGADDPLFPIRFLWLFEGNEQRLFDLPALGRSRYHPEILLYKFWNQSHADAEFKKEMEEGGILFDESEKAIALSVGWVLIGDSFVDDLREVESVLGVELLFPDDELNIKRPAFREPKYQAL